MTETPHKHAPRGPLKQRDPLNASDPMKGERKICTATNRQGRRCGKSPILGGTVCRLHGGAAPQVKLKAAERLAAYQDRAIDRLFELVEQTAFPSTALTATRDILDRTMGKPIEKVEQQHSGNIVITWQGE